MHRPSLTRDKRGFMDIIPLTIVCVTMAIAISCWVFGVTSIFVKGGRFDIKAIYAMKKENSFMIFMEVKNIGSAASVIDRAYLNDIQYSSEQLPLTVQTGQSEVIKITVPVSDSIQSGLMIQVSFHTIDGLSYSTMTVLP